MTLCCIWMNHVWVHVNDNDKMSGKVIGGKDISEMLRKLLDKTKEYPFWY